MRTARKYLQLQQLPSELKTAHNWPTRKDPFQDIWPQIETSLGLIPALEAKTLFELLQREYPGRFSDGQLRTLQRRVKIWWASHGPAKHLTTAVQKTGHPEIFTRRYQDLIDHYSIVGCKTNPASPNENGDVEQRHHRFKRAFEQSLLLIRGLFFHVSPCNMPL